MLWAELEVVTAGRQARLDKIHSQALQTWPAAVRAAEEEVLEVKQHIAASLEAIGALCQELGLSEDLGSEVSSNLQAPCLTTGARSTADGAHV